MNGIVQYENKFNTETELIETRNRIITNLEKLVSRFKYDYSIVQTYSKQTWNLLITVHNE